MPFVGATERRRRSFSSLLNFWTLFLTFHRLNAAGHIDLTIRQLLLRRAPAGCCSKNSASFPSVVDCRPLPSMPFTSYNDDLCALEFRLCVSSVDHLSSSAAGALSQRNCDIVSPKFSVAVRSARPFSEADRTFAADAPFGVVLQRRFDFTSPLTANVSIQLELFHNNKLLLFSHFVSNLMPSPGGENAQMFQYVSYGNVLSFQLEAKCAVGSVGPKCTEICTPPKPGDHYICTGDGMRCVPGWGGTRCLQPICLQQCANGGRCVRPNQCECHSGWTGGQCDQCVPRAGCRNGHCTDQHPGSCFCLPNWTGPNCDVLINKCLQRPCKNGGKCSTLGVNGDFFRCVCPPGFTGRDCAISFANCKNAACAVHQQCVPLEHGYTCVCLPTFDGPNCGQQSNNGRHLPFFVVAPRTQNHQNGRQFGGNGAGGDGELTDQSSIATDKQKPNGRKQHKIGGEELNKFYALIFHRACVAFFVLFGLCLCCNFVARWFKKIRGSSNPKQKLSNAEGRPAGAVISPNGSTRHLTAQTADKNGRNAPLLLCSERQNLDQSNKDRTRKSFKSLVVRAMAASHGKMPQGAATDVERQQQSVVVAPGAAVDTSAFLRRSPSVATNCCSTMATTVPMTTAPQMPSPSSSSSAAVVAFVVPASKTAAEAATAAKVQAVTERVLFL